MKVGTQCPQCGHVDSFEAIWWEIEDWTNVPLRARLHCVKCEHVWVEDWDT